MWNVQYFPPNYCFVFRWQAFLFRGCNVIFSFLIIISSIIKNMELFMLFNKKKKNSKKTISSLGDHSKLRFNAENYQYWFIVGLIFFFVITNDILSIVCRCDNINRVLTENGTNLITCFYCSCAASGLINATFLKSNEVLLLEETLQWWTSLIKNNVWEIL